MYKPFGECFGPPRLPQAEFLRVMSCIFRGVYRTDPAQECELLRDLVRQLQETAQPFVPWSAPT
jgi:hypothetical protein